LEDDTNRRNPIPYPCHVVNIFECPYDSKKGNSSNIGLDLDHLFDLARMDFAVEISLTVARRTVQIKNKQDLYHALTNLDTFDIMLKQGSFVVLIVLFFNSMQRNEKDLILGR
jgi:hypothetical protein